MAIRDTSLEEGGELRSTDAVSEFKLGPLLPSKLERRETVGGVVREEVGCSLWMMMESFRERRSRTELEDAEPAAFVS